MLACLQHFHTSGSICFKRRTLTSAQLLRQSKNVVPWSLASY